jgi:hypothetical protein
MFKRRRMGRRTLLQVNLLLRHDVFECGPVFLGQLAGEIHDHVLEVVSLLSLEGSTQQRNQTIPEVGLRRSRIQGSVATAFGV